MGSKSQPAQTSTSSAPPTQVLDQYMQLMGQAQNVAANNPYQAYSGEFVAPWNATQQGGLNDIGYTAQAVAPWLAGASQDYGQGAGLINQGASYFPTANADIGTGFGTMQGALPVFGQAQQYATQGTQSLASEIPSLMSPYTQDVVNATEAQFNNQNAVQSNSLLGQAIQAGNAFGGDREGIAQAQLANQQQLAEAPVIAGLYNQGFQTALGGAEAQNAEALQAAGITNQTGAGIGGLGAQEVGAGTAQGNLGLGLGSLGSEMGGIGTQVGSLGLGMGNQGLTEAQLTMGAGTQQQQTQQAQDTALYNQFLQQQAFPYQQLSWLGNLTEGLGANMGGQSQTTTQPASNLTSQIIGGGLTAASLFLKQGGSVNYDDGGVIPGLGGIPGVSSPWNLANAPIAHGVGIPDAPKPTQPQSQSGLDKNTTAGLKAIAKKLKPNGYNPPGGISGGPSNIPGEARGVDPNGPSSIPPEASVDAGDAAISFGAQMPEDLARGGVPHFDDGGDADIGDSGGVVPDVGEPVPTYTTPDRDRDVKTVLLDAIAKGESTGYNELYNGSHFSDYGDHPRQAIPITSGPYAGQTSSAAGRYQFLAPTWDSEAKKLGLRDFSPKSQDAAAWDLAATTYNSKTGRDLEADLRSGKTRDVANALRGVWPSLPGGDQPNGVTGSFENRLRAGLAGDTQDAGLASAEPQGHMGAAGQIGPPGPPGVVGSPSSGGLFNMSDEARQGLMAAGLALMGNRSQNLFQGIGEAGLAGMSVYSGAKKLSEEARKTQAQINRDEERLRLEDERFRQTEAHQNVAERQAQQRLLLEQQAQVARDKQAKDALELRRQEIESGKMPPGFRKTEEGTLEPIPGGPADPKYIKESSESKRPPSLLSPEAADIGAERLLRGDLSVLNGYGHGVQGAETISDIQNRAASKLVAQGMAPDAAAAYVSSKIQEYKATGIGLNAQTRTAGNRLANLELIERKLEADIPNALAMSNEVGRTNWVPINKLIQGGQIMTSDPKMKLFAQANLTLAEAWARAMNPQGVMRESDRDIALGLLNTATGPEAYKQQVQSLLATVQRERAATSGAMKEMATGQPTESKPTTAPRSLGSTTPDEARDRAKKAIANGADREAVIGRLKELGVDPSGI